MAFNINSYNCTGHLGNDPESRFTQSGTQVTNFNLAITTGRDSTLWIRTTVWGKLAEFANEYLRKGSFVGVTGRLVQDSWEDDSGNRRSSINLVANAVQLLDKKGSSGGGSSASKEKYSGDDSTDSDSSYSDGDEGLEFPF